ncbi:MAG: hypothetical protein N3A54_00510 [Patescibacteria group bacterium]|nr:hypothetical protein [Patescibacteria group bacterium]
MTNKCVISERRVRLGGFLVRVDRIRKGKVQRKKIISARKNYKFVRGKIKRMTSAEIRKRKIGMRRAKYKRRAKKAKALFKRRISILKGKRLGLYK